MTEPEWAGARHQNLEEEAMTKDAEIKKKVKAQMDEIVAEILRDVSGVDALRYYTDKFLSIDHLNITSDEEVPRLLPNGVDIIDYLVALVDAIKQNKRDRAEVIAGKMICEIAQAQRDLTKGYRRVIE